MPTTSSLSLNDPPSHTHPLGVGQAGSLASKEEHNREIFSHQTLILTALTAINNRNHHPTFKATEVEKERIQYMKDNVHTSVIDAATTILVTDTEILATMTRGVQTLNAHTLVAIKEINQRKQYESQSKLNKLLNTVMEPTASAVFLQKIDEVLPDSESFDLDREKSGDSDMSDSNEGYFLTIPNPNDKISLKPNDSEGIRPSASGTICERIFMGEGLWTHIWKLKCGFSNEPTTISFGTHVATVQEYLNWYRSANDEDRQDGSRMFTEYLISACWPKMEQRIGHWASVGLMNILFNVTLTKALARHLTFSQVPIDDQASQNGTRSDFRLSVYLRALEKSESLKELLTFHEFKPSKSMSGPTETRVLPCLQLQCRDNPHDLYNTKTALEFHHLLVACLLYYAKSLRKLRISNTVGKHIRTLIKLIIDYERKTAKKLEKQSKKQSKSCKRGDNANVASKHSGTVEESDERKGGNLMEKKGSGFPANLESLIDEEVKKMSFDPDEVEAEATEPGAVEEKKMKKPDEVEAEATEPGAAEEKKMKKIAKLKSHLDGMLDETTLFLDDVTPEAAEEAKQGGMTKNLLMKLKSYFDIKLSTPLSLPATNNTDTKHSEFNAVHASYRVLNAILYSRAFQRHIELLVTSGHLTFPSDTSQNAYRGFAGEQGIPWRRSRRTMVLQTVREIGNADLDPEDSGNEDSGDGDSDNADSDEELERSVFGSDTALAIQGCMNLFVQHYRAKRVLETFARHEGSRIPIEIKAYGVSPLANPLPLPTWEALKMVMRISLQDKSAEDQDKIIDVFKSHFNTTDKALSPSKNAIYNVIGNIIAQESDTTTKKRNRYYKMHCEVALISLVAASKSPEIARFVDANFLAELKKLNPKRVAVSKLCCPACWEYFDVLSKEHIALGDADSEMYKIRGRHSTVFPVQLPIWSSPDVVEVLINRFKKYLQDGLDTMWSESDPSPSHPPARDCDSVSELNPKEQPRSGHRHTPSFQSAITAISDASKNSAESNTDALYIWGEKKGAH